MHCQNHRPIVWVGNWHRDLLCEGIRAHPRTPFIDTFFAQQSWEPWAHLRVSGAPGGLGCGWGVGVTGREQEAKPRGQGGDGALHHRAAGEQWGRKARDKAGKASKTSGNRYGRGWWTQEFLVWLRCTWSLSIGWALPGSASTCLCEPEHHQATGDSVHQT